MSWFESILLKALWVMSWVESKSSETELIRLKKMSVPMPAFYTIRCQSVPLPSFPLGDFGDDCDAIPFRDAVRHKYSVNKL